MTVYDPTILDRAMPGGVAVRGSFFELREDSPLLTCCNCGKDIHNHRDHKHCD